jgi:peptide-methionine (S)-S-oxide reductase
VIRTRVGYAGGEQPSPTYQNIGDHTETIQIDFDPQKISYAQLLEIFWQSHDPTVPAVSRQYMSILFYHDEAQKQLAEQSRQDREAQTGETIYTEIQPVAAFTRAEDYHQKYILRRDSDLLGEFTAKYPIADDLTDSTAAARINGFLAGEGKAATLEAEIDSYGLSEQGREKLLAILPNLEE